MSSHIKEGALAEWEKGIKDQMAFLAEPDQHRMKMLGLANEAYRMRAIGSDQLSDMLEWLDAARVWAEVELSEAERVGLFVGRAPGRWLLKSC
ncbi:hypothetical protein NLO98_13210 [Pseudomonas syringae]|nr:hypothetical protein [Pseudomonas syringae]